MPAVPTQQAGDVAMQLRLPSTLGVSAGVASPLALGTALFGALSEMAAPVTLCYGLVRGLGQTLPHVIIPQIIGNSSFFLGQAVYTLQGTAGNIPLAAAFTVVPIVIMGFYLWAARRMGAFDAL